MVYRTNEELKKRLEASGVSYGEEMSNAQLQALVDVLPPSPEHEIAAKLPTREEVIETRETKIEKPVGDTAKNQYIIDLERQIADLTEMVRQVSDKGRLSIFDDQRKSDMGKICHVSVYNGKVVLGWSKMTKNKVIKYLDQPHRYEQETEVYFQDGSKEVIDYVMFHRDRTLIKAIVESETYNSKTGKNIWLVATKDYGNFEIDTTFIN